MADISLLGATYNDVPAVDLPKTGGGTARFHEVSGSQTLTQNGTYDVTTKAEVVVNVSGGGGAVVVTETPDIGGGVKKEITAVDISNDTVDAAHLFSGYTAHDSSGTAISGNYMPPVYQSKTKTYTPSASIQTESISPDVGYDALSSVSITVDPVSLQAKSKTYSPTSSVQTETISADAGYDGLSSVSITVNAAASKNVQVAAGVNRVNTTNYTAVSGQTLTVSKAGTYDIYWSGYRSSTSGTNDSQLFINNSSYGSAQTTFSNNGQAVHLSNVTLAKDDVIAVRARARGTSYYMYVSNLTIVEA